MLNQDSYRNGECCSLMLKSQISQENQNKSIINCSELLTFLEHQNRQICIEVDYNKFFRFSLSARISYKNFLTFLGFL